MSLAEITLFFPGLAVKSHSWQHRGVSMVAGEDGELYLCQLFGLNAKPSIAYLSAIADGLPRDRYYLRADPMALQVDWVHVYLLGNEHLQLQQEEVAKYLAVLNHQQTDKLIAPHPLRWYLVLNEKPMIQTSSVQQALGKTIADTLPQGPERTKWLKQINDWQMLLHDCVLNQQRQQQGLAAVDSLWLWGAGENINFVPAAWSQIYTDCVLTQGLALLQSTKAKVMDKVDVWQIIDQADGKILISSMYFAGKEPQQDDWQQCYHQWLLPLIKSVREGKITQLTCYFADGQSWQWTQHRLRPWYKKLLPIT